MRVKFESEEYRYLAVRERPDKGAPIARKIERGCEFDVEDEPEGGWYHIPGDYPGYVMAEFVTPVEKDDEALQKMTKPELMKLAEQSGVEVKQTMKKAEIIEALLNG